MSKPNKKPWFKNAVLYQIYPRSFQDSNHDGVGDLNGIRQRLDYLNDGKGGGLGVDCIWISPFYPSPMKDFGYDIKDYQGVDPIFGSLKDFDNLLEEAHSRGIRLLIDLVPNHTSDQHPWFKQSRKSKTNSKSDWYIWRDANDDGTPPNNWISVFGGSGWEWDDTRRQYYFHSFLKEQPDLNWENPEVKRAIGEVVRYWLDKGVDGIRVDAIDLMGKDLSFKDEPVNPDYTPEQDPYNSLIHIYSRDTGNFFSYLRDIAKVAGEYQDRLVVLESYILERHKPELYLQFYKEINQPFCVPFNFELIFMDWNAEHVQSFIDGYQTGMRAQDVPIYILGNHDQPRFISKVGPDAGRSAALLVTSLPGISLIYNGEEIGMENAELSSEYLTDPYNRDAFRTPMHWSDEQHAGFSKTAPWLPVASNHPVVNVATQTEDPDSLLNLYRQLIGLRKSLPALRDGKYVTAPHFKDVVSFVRKTMGQTLLVLVNFSDAKVKIEIKGSYKLIVSTVPAKKSFNNSLEPYEGVILEQAA